MNRKNDYTIHAVSGVYENVPVLGSRWMNYHTHGLEKYDLTNLSIVVPYEENERPQEILNAVADMMINGELFDSDVIHCIDDEDGNTKYKFGIKETTCFGEETVRLILTDPVTNDFENDSEYALQLLADVFENEERLCDD